MPNSSGAYQPFGSGWNNLSNYLTKSNLGATGSGEKSGGDQMERYKNPDAGSQFDDWLAGVNQSRVKGKDISTKPEVIGSMPSIQPPPSSDGEEDTSSNPAQKMAERKRGWMEETQGNPYRNRNPRYQY